MRTLLAALLPIGLAVGLSTPTAHAAATVLVVVGAEGVPEYGRQFSTWAERWERAAAQSGARFLSVGRGATAELSDRDQFFRLIADEPKEGLEEFWVVLIGHGTFDGRSARFNLRGPDFTESELADALAGFRRPTAVINCASSSAPFIPKLSAPNRVVITATRTGNEQNLARFGDYLSSAIADESADIDKDGQTSLLEAFLSASRAVAEFYRTESRLSTEHALIDDNGDGLGTPADWFRGIRAEKRAKDGASHDGYRAHQFVLVRSDRDRRIPAELVRRRSELELNVAELRDKKSSLTEDAYYHELEPLLLQLARLHKQIEQEIESQAPGTR